MSNTRVSVVIPCFNDGQYLVEALASVFAQSAKDIEIIIVDDCSTDPLTIATLLELEADHRVKLLRQANRQGPAAARNLAIEHASGSYILPLDADDRIMPTYVESAQSLLESNSALEIVYCKARHFGLLHGAWDLPAYRTDTVVLHNVIFATAMFRRSTWELVGGYSENMLDGMEDYDFWLKIIARGGAVHRIEAELFHYRVKPHSRTVRLVRNNRTGENRAYETLLRNNAEFFSRPENLKTIFFAFLGRARFEHEVKSSLLWRLFFTHLVSIELRCRSLIRRLMNRE